MPRAASVSLPPPALSSWSGGDAMTPSAKNCGGRASQGPSQTSHENQAGGHGMRSSAEDHLASSECMEIDAGGPTSRDDGNSAAGCLGSRNRKPSRRLQEAVHDYEDDPADYQFQKEIIRIMSFGRAVGCVAPEQPQRKRGWKARREEEAQFLIKVRNRFPSTMGKGVPGLVRLDEHWDKCMVGGRVGTEMLMREIVFEDGTKQTNYVHSLVRDEEIPESDFSATFDCVLEPYGSEAWADIRCGRHVLVLYDDVYYLGFIAWHRKNVEKAWHIVFEDGEELDIELPTREEDGAILMPLSWSEDVLGSPAHTWWGHRYAAMVRDGESKPDKISQDEMEELVKQFEDRIAAPVLPSVDDPLCSGWGDWVSRASSETCQRRDTREEVVLGGRRITIQELTDIVDRHGGPYEVTKGRQWTSLSGKLGIKTIKGSGSSLRRWYYGFHGIGNEGEPTVRRLKVERSFKDTMAVISQSALEEPIEAHQQGLAFIFGPLFLRGVNGEQKFRACAMAGQACSDECDCRWVSFKRSWECDGQGDADSSFSREEVCSVETEQAWKGADPMAPRRCCGCIFLRSKDLRRHWEEKHVQGVGVCADGYRDPRRTKHCRGTKAKHVLLRCHSPE